LSSVFTLTLSKEPFALGKGFAECGTRQSPLGNIFVGKWTLPSAFYRGTRQNIFTFCRVPGKALGKIFAPSLHRTLPVTLSSARLALVKIFFLFFLTLPSAPGPALGKVFSFFKKHFAECHRPDTRQSFFLFKKNITLPSAACSALSKVFSFF
jgi:hypothetical protein